ncbi:MAG TPA: indole-3-glycerol phosphate synthase TrpC [Symbiobacteriaceae bacterium]|jgi:indole-3-glycerol phosphate synthase
MILEQILATKVAEVAAARAARPLDEVRAAAAAAPAPRSFYRALAEPAGIQVIAEVKKASPSKGLIRPDFDPVAIARAYEAAGAACISVLTDEQYFQGSLAYLKAIRAAVSLPLLRKDFMIDEYQVYEARAAGADCVLLIVSAFYRTGSERTMADLSRLAALAHALSMDVLIEVHDADELAVALSSGAKLIGINNRDLRTFETSLDVTFQLAKKVPPVRLMVSESGIQTHADLSRLAGVGVKAVLVGESLMRSPSVGVALQRLRLGDTFAGQG